MIETSADAGVRVEIGDKIASITLDRPEQMNSITLEMARALANVSARLEDAARRDEVRVAVIRGAGERAFCTGADLKQRAKMSEGDLWLHADLIRRFVLGCHSSTVPVIAAIHGYCVGGGLEIAVGCDLRYASADAKLGFTEARIGAFPGAGGAVFTPRLVGQAVAKDLLFTGRTVSGSEAERIGLVNEAMPREVLFSRVDDVAATIAANGPLAVKALKQLLNHGTTLSIDGAFALSDALRRPLNSTADYAEGLKAFGERRQPIFEGR